MVVLLFHIFVTMGKDDVVLQRLNQALVDAFAMIRIFGKRIWHRIWGIKVLIFQV